MKRPMLVRANIIVVLLGSLFVMMLFSACSGVASTGTGSATGTSTTWTLVGSVQSVNPSAGSVTLLVNQQQYTITGLTSQQIADLQAHQGKTYTIQVTQNGNTYTITPGGMFQETDNATSGATPVATSSANNGAATGVNEPGSIDFTGKVQSANANSIVVSLPNGDPLTMNITVQTERSDFVNGQINPGQYINAKVLANPADGSFVASKLSQPDQKDLQNPAKMNTVDIAGVTTSAVGSDNVLHVKVGSKAFDFTLSPTTQMKDFGGNALSIATNQPVKVTVMYNGSSASVLKVQNSNS